MPMYFKPGYEPFAKEVKGLYLGSVPYSGYAIGSDTTSDYGVVVYSDPAIASDTASWTLNQGTPTASIGHDSNGVSLQQGVSAGGFNAGISITMVVGRKYEIKAKLSSQSQDALGQIYQGGVADGGSIIVLSAGDTYEYTFTSTNSDFELQLFNFNLNPARIIYVEEVYFREVA